MSGSRRGTWNRPRGGGASAGDNRGMLQSIRSMPAGIRLFLVYALLILAAIGVVMPRIVNDMGDSAAPISLPGVVAMALLAYTIFTTTLVLQRKEAGYNLALVLASLTIPAIPLAWISLAGLASRLPITLIVTALAVLLFAGLTRPSVRAYLTEP